ncbi:MAG: hypothetical protein M1381_06305 [Deltaproteobacteria bacterium]|nr:hypothetical protein [Deltaproteobacteria bacterium]
MRINRLILIFITIIILSTCTKRTSPSSWQVIGNMPEGRADFSAVVSYSFPTETDIACDPFPCGVLPLSPIEKVDINGTTGFISSAEVLPATLWKDKYWITRYTTFTVSNAFLYAFMALSSTGTSISTSVFSCYAHINPDGTIGMWKNIANPIVDKFRYFSSTIGYGNWIYSLGGFTEISFSPYIQPIGSGVSTSSVSDVIMTNVNSDGSIRIWQTTTAMLAPRGNFGAVAFSGYVYAIGGQTPTGVTNTVEMAQVMTDGTLGFWKYTSPLNTPREGCGIIEYNGYIYVIGGDTSNWGMNTVEMAKINPDGSLSTWSYTSPLQIARTDFNVVVLNERIYAISGGVGTIEYADIHSDGILGSWKILPSFGFVFSLMSSIAYQSHIYLLGGAVPYYLSTWDYQPSYLYIIGGYAPTVTTSIQMVTIDGSRIGGWSEVSDLWEPRAGLSAVTNMGFIYTTGGEGANGALNNMEVTYPTDATGMLGKGIVVDETNGMPTGGGAISTGCDMCIIGGAYNGVYSGNVRCAPLFDQVFPGYPSCAVFSNLPQSHNGIPMGDFITTSVLNTARYKSGVVIYPPILSGMNFTSLVYALGGYYTGTSITNSVEYAQVMTDGTLGNWQYTSSMNLPRAAFAAVAISGWVYAVGGYTDKGITNTVEKAPINPDGSLGKWVFIDPMTIPRAGLAVVEDNGWIYALGGISTPNGMPLDTIEAARMY